MEVGRVIGAWGVKGALKIHAHASTPEALFSSKRWYLSAPERVVPAASPKSLRPTYPRLLRVVDAREQGDAVVAVIDDISDRDTAQSLAGAGLHVPRSSFPTAAKDEFYWVDLIGLSVLNREGVAFGEVVGLQETGPHCVLQLSSQDGQGQQRMIPFVSAYVDKVELQERRILVDWSVDY